MSRTSGEKLQDGINAHRSRHYGEAERWYREILEDVPDDLQANFMLGILTAQTNREDEAIELLKAVSQRDPNNFEALKWLAGVLSFKGHHAEAESYAHKAVALRGTDYDAKLKLSTAYFGQDKFVEAAQTFVSAIKLDRTRVDAYYGLATTFLRLGEPLRARDVLRDAVKISPSPDSLLKLGEVSLACEDPTECIACADKTLAMDPNNVDALILKVRGYRNAQLEMGEDLALADLVRIAPDHPLGHTLIGRRLQAMGEFPSAEAEFLRSIELLPLQGVAYYGITAGRRLTQADRELIDQMELVALDPDLKPDESAHLHFALGKAYDNIGEYGSAMAHFDIGNRLMRELRMGIRRFDRDEATAQIDRIIQLFTKPFIESQLTKMGTAKEPVPIPIFIAGIMRSGTTLAEQILSCHPMVGGGGEQAFWRPAESNCVNYRKRAVDRDSIKRKALEYCEVLASISPGHPYVTDKNPANRLVYGLIHLAFPVSRIIHMRRNPVDVAISIYTTLIRTGAPFVGDKDDIVFALKEHERLVDHWREVLPEDRLLEVEYEDLVQDRERQTRRIVEFCDLPWDESCLRPEDNLRTVVTPSFWQVRQPVYTASLARWRKYEPWLGPFASLKD